MCHLIGFALVLVYAGGLAVYSTLADHLLHPTAVDLHSGHPQSLERDSSHMAVARRFVDDYPALNIIIAATLTTLYLGFLVWVCWRGVLQHILFARTPVLSGGAVEGTRSVKDVLPTKGEKEASSLVEPAENSPRAANEGITKSSFEGEESSLESREDGAPANTLLEERWRRRLPPASCGGVGGGKEIDRETIRRERVFVEVD